MSLSRLMAELLRVLAQYLHVLAGILWVGGGFYTLLVQVPALMAVPPAARGPALGQIAPRQIRYLLRLAEITLATGVLNLVATGRVQQFMDPLGQRWTVVLGLGIVLAFVLYGLLRARIVPGTYRVLALGPAAAAGDAAAAAEIGTIVGRLVALGRVQIVLGLAIVLAMVLAHFS